MTNSLLPACTEMVRTQKNISSPGHPQNYERDSWCIKWIQAPPCHTPVLTFHAFHLYGRNTYGDDHPRCYLDYLEIRNESLYSGEVYCDKEIYPGQVFTSSSADLILYFKSQTDYFPGWGASITFTPIAGCVSNVSTTAEAASLTTATTPPGVPVTTTTNIKRPLTVTTTSISTPTPTISTETTTTTTTSLKDVTTASTTFSPAAITPAKNNTITSHATSVSVNPTRTTTSVLSTNATSSFNITPSITTTVTTVTPRTITSMNNTTTTPVTTNTHNTTTPATTKTATSSATFSTTTTTSTTALTSTIPTSTEPDTTTDTGTSTSDPNCGLEDRRRRYHWTSPNFPCQNYSDNFICIIRGGSRRPFWAIFRFNVFQLPRGCGDQVTLSLPFSREVTFCGVRSRPYLAPTFNFEASFTSDASITDIGFNITVTPKRSPCHKRILLNDDDTQGNITTWKTGNVRQLVMCEWWVEAPQGKRLQVERVMTAIAQTKDCSLDYLVINGDGQKKYPANSSLIYCGWTTVAFPLTTNENLLLVVYRGRVPWSKGFVLHYQVLT